MMKRLFLVGLVVFFLSGCGTLASESEFWKHDSLYKNWEHTKFSLWGYKKCDPEDAKKTREQGWWGISPGECETK